MTQPTPESQTPAPDAQLVQRVNELEMRMAFMDDALDQLNHTVAAQDRQLRDLHTQMRLLCQQWIALQGGDSGVAPFDPLSNIPPHY